MHDSVNKLREILSELDEQPFVSNELKQKLFRAFHTIKGTSQVLGLKTVSQIAHQLENLIQHNEIVPNHLHKEIQILINALKGKLSSEEFNSLPAKEEKLEPEILPSELVQRLSHQEKKLLTRAILEGKNILVVSKSFQVETFADEFKEFQSEFSDYAEIVASFCRRDRENLDFQFVLTTSENAKGIEGLKIEKFLSARLLLLMSRLIAHGKQVALSRGKEIQFEFYGDFVELPENLLDSVFEILLHLIRNSVDHGIARQGKIKIEVRQESNKLILCLSDNGQGIDLAKVKKKAIEKGIIHEETELSNQEILSLIFTPGLSTSDEVSEISGRGIGLDVIKQKIEEKSGSLQVQTSTEGTSFEIVFNV